MVDTDLLRTPALQLVSPLGTRWQQGPRPVPDRDWIGAGGGGVYSTLQDLAGYAEALMHGGANRHGRVLKEETLAQMFDASTRLSGTPGLGLAFFRTDVGGHRVLSHDGILPGFNAHLAVAPDDGVARRSRSRTDRAAPCAGFRPRWTACYGPCSECRGNAQVDVALQPGDLGAEICGRYVLPEPGDLVVGWRWPAGSRSSSGGGRR